MESIFGKITDLMITHAERTGSAAQYIYLGAEEWRDFNAEVEALAPSAASAKIRGFSGAQIILVMKKNHLTVG